LRVKILVKPPLIAMALCLFLTSCISLFPPDKIDLSGNMTRKDYLALRDRDPSKKERPQNTATDEKQPIVLPLVPDLPPPVAAPTLRVQEMIAQDQGALSDKKISVTVTDTVPLRDVLIELGRQGAVNLGIDPRIKGGIIFWAI